jgi:TPR repeat protein
MVRFFSRAFFYLIPVAVGTAFTAHAESKIVNWMFVPPAVQQTIMQNVGAGNQVDKVYYVTDDAGKITYQAMIKKADGSMSEMLVAQNGALDGKENSAGMGEGPAKQKIDTPFEEGNAAYSQGDYGRALKILTPWAQQGNVSAQTMLGTMYMEGKGTDQDYEEARKWFKKAAQQNNVSAQFNMAIMSYNGDGGEQNDVEAYTWFALAAKNGNKTAARHLKTLSRKMPADSVKEAQRKVAAWKPGVPEETASE